MNTQINYLTRHDLNGAVIRATGAIAEVLENGSVLGESQRKALQMVAPLFGDPITRVSAVAETARDEMRQVVLESIDIHREHTQRVYEHFETLQSALVSTGETGTPGDHGDALLALRGIFMQYTERQYSTSDQQQIAA